MGIFFLPHLQVEIVTLRDSAHKLFSTVALYAGVTLHTVRLIYLSGPFTFIELLAQNLAFFTFFATHLRL